MNAFLAFLHEHGLVLTPPAVGAVLLLVARYVVGLQTPEQWVALGERSPRLQGLLRFARGAGLDPVKALQGIEQMLTGVVTPDSALRAAELAVENAALRAALARLGASPSTVIEAAAVGRDPAPPNPQSGRASVAAMAVCLVLSLAGMLRCSGPQHPGDAGADWRPGTTIALVVIDGSVQAALAEDAATGLAGADLATYDAALRGAHDALQSAEGHIANGASACQLHTDAALLVDLFERVAAILSAQGKPVPSSIVSGAARLAGVLDAILPPCVDAGAGLSARLRVAYRLPGGAR